jgi:endonuclease/exonuclease/phosphatase family metal-dependent hydrolase
MMHSVPWMIVLMVAAMGCQQRTAPQTAVPAKDADLATTQSADGSLKIMTFNLRYASPKPPNAWWQRREAMKECIQSVNPDVFGTQEGLYSQLKDIEHDLRDYAWIGPGRDGGSRGEAMAIFYRKSRLEPLEYDYFWLSDTPNVIASSNWGNTNRRMVTWVKFLDHQTNKQFYFWDTHLDHAIQSAREKGADLIRKRVEPLGTILPIILVGDFNAAAKGNKAYDILTEGGFFKDPWEKPEVGTFHNFTGNAEKLGRIDWIFTRGDVTADQPEVIRFNKAGQYPSDHYAVATRVKM